MAFEEYVEIQNYVLNVEDIQPEDYETFEEYEETIRSLFGNNFNSGVQQALEEMWDTRVNDYDDDIKTPKVSINEELKKISKKIIPKKEQTVQSLRVIQRPITIAEFIEKTGMNYNTARRELGQGVKKGLFKRVGRGLYEEL